MQTPGHLVSTAAKLPPCMKDGKDHLHGRKPRFMVDAYRDPPAVICDSNGKIFIDHNGNGITKSRKSFVNGIINNFVHKMMEPPGRSRTDIHTRPFPYRLKPFQYLNLVSSVFVIHIL